MPRLTPKEAQGLMNAYAKVYAPKEEEEASTDTESSKEEPTEVKSEKSEE